MLGLGENDDEIVETMRDLRSVDCDILTLGNICNRLKNGCRLRNITTPEEFARFKEIGLEMGFRYVESGPLVRSSYHAHEHTAGVIPVDGTDFCSDKYQTRIAS